MQRVCILSAAQVIAAVFVALGSGPVLAEASRNLTADQVQTLAALARDYASADDTADAQLAACIRPYDEKAADATEKERVEDALKMVEGTARRLGYTSYLEISDDHERRRLSKMLAEGPWMRQFRSDMERCLAGGADPGTR